MAVTNAQIDRVDTASAVQVTLAAPNRNRRGLFIFNDSSVTLFVSCIDLADSGENWTVKVGAQKGVNLKGNPIYVGIVTGILEAADAGAAAQVTEFYG